MKHQCGTDQPSPQLVFEHLITQLQAAVSQSINGVTLRGSLPLPFTSASATATNQSKLIGSAAPGRLMGIEVRETSTTNPILVRLYDGDPSNGILVAAIPLTAGASVQRTYPGRSFVNGLTAKYTALDGLAAPVGVCEGTADIGAAAEGS